MMRKDSHLPWIPMVFFPYIAVMASKICLINIWIFLFPEDVTCTNLLYFYGAVEFDDLFSIKVLYTYIWQNNSTPMQHTCYKIMCENIVISQIWQNACKLLHVYFTVSKNKTTTSHAACLHWDEVNHLTYTMASGQQYAVFLHTVGQYAL